MSFVIVLGGGIRDRLPVLCSEHLGEHSDRLSPNHLLFVGYRLLSLCQQHLNPGRLFGGEMP